MRCAYSSLTCPAEDDVPWHSGGDIVAVVETSAAVRVLIGDVMGHGPLAGETAGEVRRAFRQLAVHEEDAAQVLAARLDRLVAGLKGQGHREEFVTAQLIDIPRDRGAGAELAIVSCGHPPPLLLRCGGARFLDAMPPSPPLGLLDLADGACPRPGLYDARAGDMMLLYTDGVTEACSATGAIYPLAERAATVSRELTREFNGATTGTALIEALRTGLIAHIGGKLRDDATLMYLQFTD